MGLFEQFPYQNFHELNLDWLINEIKTLETSGLVLSVNGMTGDVTLYEENIVRLPDVANSSWNLFRKNDGQDNGIEFTKNMPMTRIQGSSRFAVYDAGNPPPYPVTSVNGATGDVTLYPTNVTQLPSVANSTWNIYRITDGQENGIEFTKNMPMTRIQGTSRFTVYDTGNPPPNFADTSAPDLQLPVDTTGTSWSINRNIGSGNLGILLGVTGGQEEAYIQFDDGVTPSLTKLLTPADIPSSSGVVSFNGQTGVVTADASTLEMSSSDSTSIDDTITNIENDIAILINVSTAAVNVAAGQYVLVQNSGMTGVQDGLYIANTAVPAGTPFTAAYLDAVSNGGLNSLNDHIANLLDNQSVTVTLPSGYSWNSFRGRKTGQGIVYLSGRIDLDTASTARDFNLGAIIPADCRPDTINVTFTAFNNASDKPIHGIITSSGTLMFYRPDTDSLSTIVFSVMYPTW